MTDSDTITARSDDLVCVRRWVPARHVVAFERESAALLTRILASGVDGDIDLATWDSTVFRPPFNSNHRGDADPWVVFDDLADTPEGRRIAVWIVDNLTEGGRRIAAAMLAHPEGKHTRELAKIGGYNDDGVSSAFRAIAGRFRACAVRPFWNGNPDTKGDARGQLLTVPTNREAYKVFLAVFEARFPEALGR